MLLVELQNSTVSLENILAVPQTLNIVTTAFHSYVETTENQKYMFIIKLLHKCLQLHYSP